jgi:hypothetical protein
MLLNVKDTKRAVDEALQNNSRVHGVDDRGTHGCFISSNITEPLPLEEIEQSFIVDQQGSHEQTAEAITTSINDALDQIEKGVACYGFIGRTAAYITYLKVAEHGGDVVINFRLSVAPSASQICFKQVYACIENGNREIFVDAKGTTATLRINGELVNVLNLEGSEDELNVKEQLEVLSMVASRNAKEPKLVTEHFDSILKLI